MFLRGNFKAEELGYESTLETLRDQPLYNKNTAWIWAPVLISVRTEQWRKYQKKKKIKNKVGKPKTPL